MLARILPNICVVLVLGVGICVLLALLLWMLERLPKDLLVCFRMWRSFLLFAHGVCPHCKQRYRAAREAPEEAQP